VQLVRRPCCRPVVAGATNGRAGDVAAPEGGASMEFARGCPGQDRSGWTADDIFEVPCLECGKPIEFFKDDARRYCPGCGACNPNPRQDIGCSAWCTFADKCSVGRNALDDT